MTTEPIMNSGDHAFVLVGVVGLVVSLRTSAEIEVLMEAEELDRVIDALQEARSEIAGERSGIAAQRPRA